MFCFSNKSVHSWYVCKVNEILLSGKRRLRKRGTSKRTLGSPYIIWEEQEKLNGHFKVFNEEKQQLLWSRRESTVLLLGTKQQQVCTTVPGVNGWHNEHSVWDLNITVCIFRPDGGKLTNNTRGPVKWGSVRWKLRCNLQGWSLEWPKNNEWAWFK